MKTNAVWWWEVILKDWLLYEHIDYVWFWWAWTIIQKNIQTWEYVNTDIEIYKITGYRVVWKKAPRYIRMLWYKYVLIS